MLFAYDLIKKKIKCDELCNKIVFNQPAPQNLRRRRPLYVDIRRRNYTFLEPLNRFASSSYVALRYFQRVLHPLRFVIRSFVICVYMSLMLNLSM